MLWVLWSQFIPPKTCIHTTETNPHSTCLSTHVTATEKLVDLMTWCSIMVISLQHSEKVSVQLSLLLHPFHGQTRTSTNCHLWPAWPFMGEVHITNTFRLGLAIRFWTLVSCRNQRSLISKPTVYCLYGGAAFGSLIAWTGGLPKGKKLLIRDTFFVCRSTWSRLLLSSGLRWIGEFGCLWQR